MNSALPSADLSGSFGKSKRAEGIKPPPARPTKKRGPGRPAIPELSQDAPDGPQEPRTPSPAPIHAGEAARPADNAVETPRPRRRGRPPNAAANTTANGARLVLWTPVSIRTRMQAVRSQQGAMYLDQVLDALEATVDELPDLVNRATNAPVVHGRLFARAAPAPAKSEERRVQLTINGFLSSHIDVIDNLVDSTGAPSRSALINAALDATLPDF